MSYLETAAANTESEFDARLRLAEELEQGARYAALHGHHAAANEMLNRASQIRGRLQRIAQDESNAAEDAKRGHTEWMGGRF